MAYYHLDCASGIAGDMFLGACLDLGMPLAVVAEAVERLGLAGAGIGVEQRRASRGGIAGVRFRVLLDGRPLEGPDPEEVAAAHEDARRAERPGGHEPPPDPHAGSHSHGPGGAHAHPHEGEDGPRHAHPPGHGRPHAHHRPHGRRDLAEIRQLLAASSLTAAVRERALGLFARLGEAEARAHGIPIDQVHFHEVGAVDSIVDLVGAAAAIEHLAPERLTCGPVNVGGGSVRTEHGELPVPAPATAELLRGIPVYGGPGGELTTPTGAVLLAELVDAFTELPPLVLEGTGYGLGRRELGTRPNALRLMRGAAALAAADGPGAARGPLGLAGPLVAAGLAGAAAGLLSAAGPPGAVGQRGTAGQPGPVGDSEAGVPRVAVVECEVDDLAGEGFGFLMERLLAAGALDVYFTPLVMKKSRPGILVSLLCRRHQLEELAGILLLESGSLGCRYHMAARVEAERDTLEVETAFGRVRIKRGRLAGRVLAMSPEYEDCRRLALVAGVPWRDVYRAALAALPAG
jgi:uncharacterized protein (TIGR00299 family) protein